MTETHICDFCGRPVQMPEKPKPDETHPIKIDVDGLWVCHTCSSKIVSEPTGSKENHALDERLIPLIGKSAGAITRTLELPYEPPYQAIIDAASNIAYDQDTMMSAWSFVTQWLDGTTVWRKSDGTKIALVSEGGEQIIQDIG